MGKAESGGFALEDQILGCSDNLLKLSTMLEFRDAALALALQAKQSLQIFSHDLESAVYNHQAFIKALTRVAHNHSTSFVQILLRDSSPAVKEGHQLVEICQRFSSDVKVRRIADDYEGNREAFLIADGVGLLHRDENDRYLGTANFNEVAKSGRLLRFFDEVWERGETQSEFRRLYI